MAAPADFQPYWPDGVDGTSRFPENHRLLHESARSKVVDVFIAAKTAEKPHTHGLRSYMFTDLPVSIAVRLVDEQGLEKLVFERGRTNQAPPRPQPHPVEPEPFHFVTNTDETDYLATRVEYKDGSRSRPLRDLLIGPGSALEWQPRGLEAVLVGDVGNRSTVSRLDGTALAPLNNTRLGAPRPPVWFLDPGSSYSILNPAGRPEGLYLLEIG